MNLIITSIIVMTAGGTLTGVATLLEYLRNEPIYKLLMKIGPVLIGVGGIIFSMGSA